MVLLLAALGGGCDSSDFALIDLVRVGEGRVLMAGRAGGKPAFVLYNQGLVEPWADAGLAAKTGQVKRLVRLSDAVLAIITEKKGIVLASLGPDSGFDAPVHLPVNEDALVSPKIRTISAYEHGGARKLYVLYETPKGSGVTEVSLTGAWQPSGYNHLDSRTTELRSDNIVQVEVDLRGNVWFNYSHRVQKGLSRLAPDGEWAHFDRNNSELPDKFVRTLRSESADNGVVGDNVWFGSVSGLTRLEYRAGEKEGDDREKWKLYGERETTSGIIARAIGVRELVSDAVLDIIDLHISEKYVLMANRKGVYTFNGKSINRFIPASVGGFNETYVSDINYRDGYVITKTRPAAKQSQYVDSVSLLDIKKRQWIKLDYWKLAREYPRDIYFIPCRQGVDLVALKFMTGKTMFATLDYKTFEIKKIDVDLKSLNLKAPADTPGPDSEAGDAQPED